MSATRTAPRKAGARASPAASAAAAAPASAKSVAALPFAITPDAALRELAALRDKLAKGAKRLGEFTEEDLAIATTPADEVYREDMVRLYRCRPTGAKRKGVAVLIVYALVGRYQMIDLETDRSFVRKLLAEGHRRLLRRLGQPDAGAALAHDRRLRLGLSRQLRRRRPRSRGHRADQPDGHLPGRRVLDLLCGALPGKGRAADPHGDADRLPRRQSTRRCAARAT
jgi:hypothetical protein